MPDPQAAASGYATTVALVTGLAWPLVAGAVAVGFRTEITGLLRVLTKRLSSAETFKLGPVEIGGIFKAAENRTRAHLTKSPTPPGIPIEQIASSEKLEEQLDARGVPLEERLVYVQDRLSSLAREYDRVRADVPSGEERTRRMDEIVALMRTLALPAIPLLPRLTASESAGERLAALAILQVRSMSGYIPWLRARFLEENQVFLLYNTALVLRRMSRLPEYEGHPELKEAVSFALAQVKSFRGGSPDAGTLDTLEMALSFLS